MCMCTMHFSLCIPLCSHYPQHCCHDDQPPNVTIANDTCNVPFIDAHEHNCTELVQCVKCDPCYTSWKHAVSNTVWVAGSFGLIFSFTQVK